MTEPRTCPACGKPVTRKGRRGPQATYCDDACRLEHRNDQISARTQAARRVPRSCVVCGAPFTPVALGRLPQRCVAHRHHRTPLPPRAA